MLKANGQVVPRKSLRPLRTSELHSPTEARKREVFDALIQRRWGDSINPPTPRSGDIPHDTPDKDTVIGDDDTANGFSMDIEDIEDSTGKILDQQPAYDTIINAEVQLQLGQEFVTGRVRRRAVAPDGRAIGTYDDNPMLNSCIYEVEFPDGQVQEYGANLIAESMLAQVNSEGFSSSMMKGIIDYKKDDDALTMDQKYLITKTGQKRMKKTTKG